MKLRAADKQWRELIDRLLDFAEEKPGGDKKLFFMEKLGLRVGLISSWDQASTAGLVNYQI